MTGGEAGKGQKVTDHEEVKEPWHASRSIPVAVLFAMAIQTCGVVWWASRISNQQDVNTADISRMRTEQAAQRELTSRVVRMETLLQAMQETLTDIRADMRERRTEK